MVTIYDVPADALIEEVAARLEDRIDEPDWVEFAKSGAGKEPRRNRRTSGTCAPPVSSERSPRTSRSASSGSRPSTGSKKRGSNRYSVRPGEHEGGSRKLIRASLQALEEDGLVTTAAGEGRRISDDGEAFLSEVAADVFEDLDRPELERYA